MTPEQRKRRHRQERLVAAVIILLAAITTAVFIVLSKRADLELQQQTTYVPKPVTITPEVELLQQYVRFDTSNPPGDELAAAQWLAGIIRSAGVEAEVIETAPRRANVYARIEGSGEGHGLLLLHHIDVVPAGDQRWSHPPFAGRIHLDQLYGRGTLDMKGTGIAFLRAFLDVARSGRRPKHDLIFLAVADEERGGTWGMRWLLEHRPDVVTGVRYALNEGGITEMSGERVTYFGIEIGTKVHSAVHVAAPTREQLQQVRIALQPWFTPDPMPDRVLPAVRRFFSDIAPHRTEFREELSDIDRTIAEGRFWMLPVGYRELTQNNVWAEAVRPHPDGGFQMRVRLINLPDQDPGARIAWLERIVHPLGARVGRIERKEGPWPLSPVDTPLYDILADVAAEAFGSAAGTEVLTRSFNDSRFLRKKGIAAYGINAFPVDFFQSEAIHGPNERLRVGYFVAGIPFVREVVNRYAFGPVTQNVSPAGK